MGTFSHIYVSTVMFALALHACVNMREHIQSPRTVALSPHLAMLRSTRPENVHCPSRCVEVHIMCQVSIVGLVNCLPVKALTPLSSLIREKQESVALQKRDTSSVAGYSNV